MSIPGRLSTASHELDFLAESLPGLAWTYYTLERLLEVEVEVEVERKVEVEVEVEVGRENGPVSLSWVGSRRLIYLPATGDLLLEDRLEGSQTRSVDRLRAHFTKHVTLNVTSLTQILQ